MDGGKRGSNENDTCCMCEMRDVDKREPVSLPLSGIYLGDTVSLSIRKKSFLVNPNLQSS